MALVTNFEQVREDGKITHPNMTASQIAALSGTIVKVVRAQWVCDEKVVGIDNAKGLSAQATASENHVAILLAEDASWTKTRLQLLRANGALVSEVPDTIEINGTPRQGHWAWLKKPRLSGPDIIGAVFTSVVTYKDGYHDSSENDVDLDAATGHILQVYKGR